MIQNLVIKNYTIIDSLDIEFSLGMTVLTGETGAGKSIIIDALSLALGSRADPKFIRSGMKQCEIIATFNLNKNNIAKDWLTTHEFSAEDECIIRRSIGNDGRSRSTLNGIPVPQQLIRELGTLLINIHGQHEYQFLLQRDKQLSLLDAFGDHHKQVAAIQNLHETWREYQSQLQKLYGLTNNHDDQIAFLNFQLQELATLSLAENELAKLHAEHKQLTHREQLMKNCEQALKMLTSHNLQAVGNYLTEIHAIDQKIASVQQLTETAIIQVEEAAIELQDYFDRLELNPERLQWIEERLLKIHDSARKHRVKPEELHVLHIGLTAQLSELTNAQVKLQELNAEIAKLETDYQKIALLLSKLRKKAANKLDHEISTKIQTLHMPNGEFKTEFSSAKAQKLTAHGLDEIEFLVRTNIGQPLLPLHKTASGGELSRLSLAIQVVIAKKYNVPTLIFDEIDAGIGGKTAQVVGEQLRELSTNSQVLCVTHLPQIAAQSHNHLKITKDIVNNATVTRIESLDRDAKIDEIARMLGTEKITKQTLALAREMCTLHANQYQVSELNEHKARKR